MLVGDRVISDSLHELRTRRKRGGKWLVFGGGEHTETALQIAVGFIQGN